MEGFCDRLVMSGTDKERVSGGILQEDTVRAPSICVVLPVYSGMEARGWYLCGGTI